MLQVIDSEFGKFGDLNLMKRMQWPVVADEHLKNENPFIPNVFCHLAGLHTKTTTNQAKVTTHTNHKHNARISTRIRITLQTTSTIRTMNHSSSVTSQA